MTRTSTHDPALYQRLVLDTVLPPDWQAYLTEARRCVVDNHFCGEGDGLRRVSEAVRNHRPGVLANLRESVVAWLNNEEAALDRTREEEA